MTSNQGQRHDYEFGPFRLDARERLLTRKDESVSLTPKAFDLLLALVERHGRLVEKEELFQVVWPDTIVEESNLSSNIALIRKALNDGENGLKYIETVPKRGYRFVAEVRDVQPAPNKIETLVAVADAESPSRILPTVATRQAHHWRRPVLILVSVVIIGLIVWAGWRFTLQRTAHVPPAKIVPFTSLPGNEVQPSFSPDGNQLVFVWDGEAGDNQDLYVKQVGNEAIVRLTTDPAADLAPCWSPDGRSIAFVRQQAEGTGLYLIPSLGGVELRLTQLTPNSGAAPLISWSPDGTSLAASDRNTPTEAAGIFLIARATGEKRRLTSPPTGVAVSDNHPAFSPDGRRIVFVRSFGALVNDLFVVPVAGGEPQRLTFDNTSVRSPVWTPDGHEILFISWREGGAPGLWRMPATGGTPEKVEAAVRNPFNLALAPQGNRLALTDDISDQNIWRLELPTTGAGAGGKELLPKPLITSTMFDANPRYSPDSKRIAFMSNRTGSQEIWLAGSNGEQPVALTSFNRMGAGAVNWSPDGSQLVFDARPEGNADIYVLSVEDRKLRRLTNDAAEDVNPSWSRDGKWVYFRSTRSGDRRIWKVPATGGDAVQVTQQLGHDGVDSPDGQFLYFTKGRNVPGIWKMPLASGEETLVLDHHSAGIWRHWAVTEAGIYFATEAQPKQTLIEFFSFATRQVTLLATIPKGLDRSTPGLSVSPDGRWLIWSQLDQQGSDILLLENFR